jgi:hypothetical protein
METQEVELKVGRFGVGKTKLDAGKIMYTWDAVRDCDGDSCPAYIRCPHPKESYCKMQVLYLESVLSLILSNYVCSEPELYRIGMHLIPLYKILCRLKIEELGITTLIYETDKGNFSSNPILKEIRETIKSIDSAWKELGLRGSVKAPVIGLETRKKNYYDDILGQETKVGWKKGRSRE